MKLIRAFGRWVRSFMRSQPSGIVAGVYASCAYVDSVGESQSSARGVEPGLCWQIMRWGILRSCVCAGPPEVAIGSRANKEDEGGSGKRARTDTDLVRS